MLCSLLDMYQLIPIFLDVQCLLFPPLAGDIRTLALYIVLPVVDRDWRRIGVETVTTGRRA
jgi:hypothetical protein